MQLLRQAKASEKVVNKFLKETQTLNVPFAQIVSAIRLQEEIKWNLRNKQEMRDFVLDSSQDDSALRLM